jgi:predicted nuclease of predicted toxin-antitoxin system
MMRPLPPIVAQLLPRLGSNFDGEIIATAKAIQRVLHSSDMDWHDLTRAITAPAIATLPRQPWTESDEAQQIRLWLEAVANEDWLNSWSTAFVANILSRQSLDRLSKRQLAVINNIIGEAHRRGCRPGREAA